MGEKTKMEKDQDGLLNGAMESLSGRPKKKGVTPDEFLKGEKR